MKRGRAGLSPRGALAAPNARPRKILRPRNDACLNRIPMDVPPYPIEFVRVANHPVKVFLLPELLAGSSECLVRPMSSRSLQSPQEQRAVPSGTSLAPETSARRPQECGRGRHECLRHVVSMTCAKVPGEFWESNRGCAKQADMIGHDRIGNQMHLFQYQSCDIRLAQVERSASRGIEEPVPGHESLARRQMLTFEYTFRRQASPEPPCDKGWHARRIDMRQAASMESNGASLQWCAPIPNLFSMEGARIGREAEASRGLKPNVTYFSPVKRFCTNSGAGPRPAAASQAAIFSPRRLDFGPRSGSKGPAQAKGLPHYLCRPIDDSKVSDIGLKPALL